MGTARDLFDYYWIGVAEAKPLLRDLVAEGELVEVEGWTQHAYLHRDATVPRSAQARALVNPFDTYMFMFNRERVERLHDLFYRIEIYVPEPKRVHGYYVFPFLLGEDLAARVDLKADRKAGVLRVPVASSRTAWTRFELPMISPLS